MNDQPYNSPTLSLSEIAARLSDQAGPTLILTHAKPDGDAFGSLVALTATLRQLGRQAQGLFVPPVPSALMKQPGAELADTWHDGYELPWDPQQVVVVDTGAWSQVGPLRPMIEPRLDRTIIIDHHLSGDIPSPHRFVDGEASAACEIVAELVEKLLIHTDSPSGRRATDISGYQRLDPVVRDALFIGIASDTGWFRFSNVRPQTHELAARLLRQGTDHAALYQQLEQAERPEKLALLTRALQNLRLLANGRVALMPLYQRDFSETGARLEETERLIDTPQMVGGIEVFVVATEAQNRDGSPQTRLSFRSKHGPDHDAVNVAKLAAKFGGGGHARAAGAKVDRPIDEVIEQIRSAIADL